MNNYEKKYKEALEKAKESLKDGTITNIAISYIESIFPELKEEIEDDRIRNWLEEHIEAMPYNSIEFKDVKRIDVLHWLEKQGEQKPQGKSALEAINEEKVDNVNKVEPKDYSSIDPHFGKPIDKVEPKFKAGDWITIKQ